MMDLETANRVLLHLRAEAANVGSACDDDTITVDALQAIALSLAEAFDALDRSLTAGGALPDDWRRLREAPPVLPGRRY